MIISNVNIGSGPGANDGESIYSAFYKVNQNFANVQSNVNNLTNSVSSVAGRTGNVTLTINDIVGLNSSYALNGNVTAANIGMKGYVDAKIAANVAALVDSAPAVLDTLNELAAALNDDASFSTTILNTITLANTIQSNQITSANIGVIGYVDNKVSTANIAMKGYVDSVASQSIYGNSNVASYLPTYSGNLTANHIDASFLSISDGPTGLDALHVGIPGISSFGNTIASFHGNINAPAYINVHNRSAGDRNLTGFIATAYSSVDPEKYNSAFQIAGENWNQPVIPLVKPYDTIIETVGGNLLISAHDTDFSANKDIVFTTGLIPMYERVRVSNSSVKITNDLIPGANVTYSLGNVTNRWKDLYLSGNTIFLGDATISTEGGRLVTTGAVISPPTGAVAFANVQFEAATNFDQIRSYYVDNNFGYTANLKTWTTAPIVWDELRSAKIKINSSIVAGSTPDFASLDTSGGRFANAVATLDATGNIASLAITDGGVGYDAYYPYYAADSTGYDTNYIGQSYTGSPTGKSFRRIGLIPTTASDVGNITSIGSFTRYSDLPTVGTNSYTWTGNTGTTISFTVDWSSNTVTSYTYTPALPALTSAQDWQDWLLDYQSTNDYGWIIGSGSITGGGGTPIQAVYDYLSREALPTSLTYDQSATTWYPGNLLINNASVTATLSSSTFFITFNRTSINYATLENDYGNPVYWSRGLSADTGISSGGDMTVAGDLRVAGDLYVSPTSIYMGDLRISAADGNLKINTGIKFSDDSVQSTAYSNVQVAAYLTANPPASTYSNVQVATYLPTYTGNVAAGNVKVSNAYRFETGNVNITNESSHLNLNPDTTANALAGVKIGGSGYLLGPNNARNITLNYNSVNGAVGLQGNVIIGSGGSGNLFVVGNVIARDITGGNILATGTSGVIGFNSGGFVQQATSNATQVTSHFTSGNIQLMSIDLGASAVHTVTFACNKLTTNDLLLVKHISGGLTSVYVDAYVASDGLAVIWLRDITGNGTGAFTPMLKYAIVRAPSS